MGNGRYNIGDISLLTHNADFKSISNFWTLVYIRKGSGIYLLEGRLTSLNESDIIFIPPGVEYSFRSEDLGDEYNTSIDAVVFRFNNSWINAFIEVFNTYTDVALYLKEMKKAVSVTGPKWMKIASLMNEASACLPHRESAIVMELLHMLTDPKDLVPLSSGEIAEQYDINEKKERIERFVACNLIKGFSLEEIADYTGMNRTYFCLFFKKHYKIGLIEYINGLKTQKAADLLTRTTLPVAEISAECGFSNVTYFNRVFKKNFGKSPREFRNQIRK